MPARLLRKPPEVQRLVQWQRSFVTGLLLESPLLLWRRGLGRGGRLHRNLSVRIRVQSKVARQTWPAASRCFLRGHLSPRQRSAGERDTNALADPAGSGFAARRPPLPLPLPQKRRGRSSCWVGGVSSRARWAEFHLDRAVPALSPAGFTRRRTPVESSLRSGCARPPNVCLPEFRSGPPSRYRRCRRPSASPWPVAPFPPDRCRQSP